MNNNIEDEKGLMSIESFKKMFYTAHGRQDPQRVGKIYALLLPLCIDENQKGENGEEFISINKLGRFIDFYNYAPIFVHKVRHKNLCSEDFVINGKDAETKYEDILNDSSNRNELEEVIAEGKQFKRILAMVSAKITERFGDSVFAAYRAFDKDHSMSLNLNEFAQGIEYLRIKIGFEDVKRLFSYLDENSNGEIGLEEFRLLSEESWRKFDPIRRYFANKKNKEIKMSSLRSK